MEFIPTLPVSVSSAGSTPQRREFLVAWARTGAAWLCLIVLTAFSCFLVARWPGATLLALAAGTAVRGIGQRLRWKAAVNGTAGRSLARFRLSDGNLECSFHEDAVNRFERLLAWRVAAALAAAAVCIAAQQFHWLPWSFIPRAVLPAWLARMGELVAPLLPLALGALVLLARSPRAHGPEALKAAIRARADSALAAIRRPSEIDGLEAGAANLYRQLDLWWAGDYRASLHSWVESHIEQVVFEPQVAAHFLNDFTEQARTDLNHLAQAAEDYRSVECRGYALDALQRAAGGTQPETTGQSARAADELRKLAIEKRWELFSQRAAELARELDDAILEFRLRSQSVAILPSGTNPYHVLGTESSAATATIKKLRLRLAQVYHPDIGGETSNDTKMAELNAAYDAVMRERATQAK